MRFEGHTHSARSRELMSRAHKDRLMRLGWVDNAPLREAVQKSVKNGTNYNQIVRRLGYAPRDTTRLKRRLGLTPDSQSGKSQTLIRYDIAVAIIRAIDRDPVDFGL